jgi:glycolate oxidase FAD binding subunit
VGEQAVYQPRTLDELERVVAQAFEDGQALEIVGNGTKRGLGRPVDAARRLELSGLRGIPMYEPEELVMTAGAGTPLAQVEAELEARGQELAFDPATTAPSSAARPAGRPSAACSPPTCRGRAGSRAGAARDHLLGLRCVPGRAGDQGRRAGGQERHRLRPVQAADGIVRHAGRAGGG